MIRNIFTSSYSSLFHLREYSSDNKKSQPKVLPHFSHSSEQYTNYFSGKLTSLEEFCKKIITNINEDKKNITKHQKLINEYLDVQSTNDYKKDTISLLSLLVGIHMTGNWRLIQFRKQIIETLTRKNIQAVEMDELTLTCFIHSCQDLKKYSIQKVKTQFLSYTLFRTLQKNINSLAIEEYLTVVKILVNQTQSNKTSYLRFAHLLQEQIVNKIFLPVLNDNQHAMKKWIHNQNFMLNTELLFINCNSTHTSCQYLFRVIDQLIFTTNVAMGKLSIQYINKLYRNFPYREKAQDGQFFKAKILKKIICFLQEDNKINFTYFQEYTHYFVSSMIHHLFYQHWRNLTFSQVDGFVFLEKSQLENAPPLPDIFWKIYSKHHKQINSSLMTQSLIKTCYPQKYIDNTGGNYRDIEKPYMQTEMRIRMEQTLQFLNIKYTKQVNVLNRFIDFMLQDGIILELDGMHHFLPYYLENNDSTSYRNIHLLMGGYRLIIISIHQYNLYREKVQLADLLKKKLDILQEYKCAAVI